MLLRHTTPAVAEGTCYGRLDLPLAESFDTEFEALKAALPAFGRLVSSPLARCRQLAEQLAAEDLTGQSELFSLGVTLYEMLIGEVPFKAGNIALLMTKITSEDPPPIASRRAGIPPSVDAVLTKALSKNPENRFASGAEMAIALRNCARFS